MTPKGFKECRQAFAEEFISESQCTPSDEEVGCANSDMMDAIDIVVENQLFHDAMRLNPMVVDKLHGNLGVGSLGRVFSFLPRLLLDIYIYVTICTSWRRCTEMASADE